MKFLLFTLLYSFSGVFFANSYVAPDTAAIAPLDTSFICDALSDSGDTSDADDLDALGEETLEDYLASIYLIKFPKFYAEANSRPLPYYHSRAPPLIA